MGRKSTKENKNIYQISRENAELTRESAAEQLEFISSDRIEKIDEFIINTNATILHKGSRACYVSSTDENPHAASGSIY